MLNFYIIRSDFLIFKGNDRLDLIHRLSTNDVNSLPKYGVRKTILTSDKGRIIDVLTLYNFGDFVLAACSPGNSASVINHLDKYIIMDDFKVENMLGTHGIILFHGEDIDRYVQEVTGLDFNTLTTEDFKILQSDGRDSIIHRYDDAFDGLIFIYSLEDEKYYFNKLFDEKLVEKYAVRETDEKEYETKRILSGIPKFANELNEQTNPLECGLENLVSFTKGCYIGQEVISRLDTYDKVSKHMIGIKFNDKLNGSLALQPKITLDDIECGFVSSYTYSENYGGIGLAFVRTPFLDYSKNYQIKLNELLINCKIIKLPFVN